MQDQPRTLLNVRWYMVVIAAYLIGLVSLGMGLRHNLGFPLDDSWIHQEIARNLIQHHSFGFTPGVTSSGSSSTLWTFVLALNYLLLPTHSPVLYPLVLNSILIIVSGVLLWRMAALDGLPLLYAIALAILPAFSGNYVWLAFIGMEHVMFVTFSLTAILLWFRPGGSEAPQEGPDTRRVVLAGLALGALGMTRPEGLALSMLLFALYRWCGRTLLDAVKAAAVAVVFLVPSFLVNMKTSGALLPMTVRGRRFLFSNTDKLHVGRSTVRGLTMETYAKVVQHNFFHTTHAWALIGVALAFYGCFVLLLRRFPSRVAMLMLWAILHYASYCFTLPATGHGGRYQPFVLVLFPGLMAIAIFHLLALAARLSTPNERGWLVPAQVAVLACFGALTAVTLPRWELALRDSIYNIDNCHLKMAGYLDAHYPAGTKMGVFDIGTIGYFSHIDLVDLGGLVDRKYLPYLISGRVPQYLEEHGVHYVILAHNGAHGYTDGTGEPTRFAVQLRFLNNPAVRLDEIHTEGIDYPKWYSSYLYTQHAYQYQTLYRITYLHPNASGTGPGATAPALN